MATTALEFDRQLIPAERYQQNLQELTDLITHHEQRFLRIAFANLGNVADAEDALQDAALAALTHVDQFKGEAKMSTWLTAIVINSARMKLRRRSRRLEIVLEESGEEQNLSLADFAADTRPNPEEVFRKREIAEMLGNATCRLSPALLRAFQLRDLYGLNIRETASILGVPSGTVKARTTRARNKLKKLMLRALRPVAPSRTCSSVRRVSRQ
jgi:RNA polymerase sigma-70 factor, ECF subfamily